MSTNDGAHHHVSADTALAAEVAARIAADAALDARLKKLETPIPPTPPVTRPFPAPTINSSVTLPPSLDKTGITDLSSSFAAFDAQVPANVQIDFDPAGRYRFAGVGIQFDAKTHRVYDGHGAMLLQQGTGDMRATQFAHGWTSGGAHDVAIRNFTIVGSNPTGGKPATTLPFERVSAINLEKGPLRIEVANVNASLMYGDGFYIGYGSPANPAPQDIWIHDSSFGAMGRNGGSVAGVQRLTVERVRLYEAGLHGFDFEDGTSGQLIEDVNVKALTVDGWGYLAANECLAVVGRYAAGVVRRRWTFDGTVIRTGTHSTQYRSSAHFDFDCTDPSTQIAVTNSDDNVVTPNAWLRMTNVTTGMVVGNRYATAGGPITALTNCSGIVTSPNP